MIEDRKERIIQFFDQLSEARKAQLEALDKEWMKDQGLDEAHNPAQRPTPDQGGDDQ